MSLFLCLADLFFIGSVFGWVLEVFFRKFFSSGNPEHRWINPGFCAGPYLPLYGTGLCVLYLLAALGDLEGWGTSAQGKAILFVFMAVSMTVIEYIGGLIALKAFHLRLWDYTAMWGNIQGLVCPLFSFFWAVLGAVYYFLIHPYVLDALHWLAENLAFSFVIGFFFGVFTVDLCYSAQLAARLRKFARETGIEVRLENLKAHAQSVEDQIRQRHHFFLPFLRRRSLAGALKRLREQHGSKEKH